MRYKITILSLALVSGLHALELGTPFKDHAILQREMDVPVWGWSKPNTSVTVSFAGQSKTAVAGKDGKWMLELAPLKASFEPAEFTVSEKSGETLSLKDILVGEVWLASGQSNMQWQAKSSDVGTVLFKEMEARIAAGEEKPPVIREAKVTDYFAALHPIEHADAEWSSDTGEFSAIALAFAYKLHRELNVPIGILNCSFSQTSIEAWTPRVGFATGKSPYIKGIYQVILEADPSTPEHKKAWNNYYDAIEKTLASNKLLTAEGKPALPIPSKTPGNLSSNRDASWLFNARLNPMIPFAIRGGIWNQGYANMNGGLNYYDNLHSMIAGWRELWGKPELPVYFHQFYTPGQKGVWNFAPSIDGPAEMRLGTYLARDIPNTGMASQIDITGAIHYRNKTISGERLALHALKNQYAKAVATDGPMFKSYTVDGDKLTISFENADKLLVAETDTQSKKGLATPTVIPGGDDQVKFFYLADAERTWHPASMKIAGNKVIISSPEVKAPRGVAYGTAGIGNQANLYNSALLPTTPFIIYDHNIVTSETWPGGALKIANEKIDPNSIGLLYEYRKMPLLSTQFRDNAVLQADKPVTIWGSARHDWGYEAKGEAVIKFNFAGIEKTIPVTPEMEEWQVILPAMKASADPKKLTVRFEIDGKLVHERVAENIVVGDVFFVAAPPMSAHFKQTEKSPSIVRMITRKAKRFSFGSPSRFSVAVSTTPDNRFASEWTDASGFAAALGNRIGHKTKRPVGIIFMQAGTTGKPASDTSTVKSWLHPDDISLAPSLMGDYKDLAAVRPGNEYYDANAQNYVDKWKAYWTQYIPEMISTKSVPDKAAWGSYPTLSASVTSEASQVHNVLVESFQPATLKGSVFLGSEAMFSENEAEHFGEQISALSVSWRKNFGDKDLPFVFTAPKAIDKNAVSIPASSLALPEVDWTKPEATLDKIADYLTK